MDWSTTILGILAALFGGLNVFQLIFFRATKKKYEAEGEVAHAEAGEAKQSAFENRIAAMENLINEQGQVMDSLRKDILKLSSEKFANERRIIQLEAENKNLREKVDQLEKEVQAYKSTIEKYHEQA